MSDLENWIPKTKLGRMVKEGKIKSIDEILDRGWKIKEPEIVDFLLPNLETDLILIGQSKGKFGGGKRRAFKQTQKKTGDGSKIKFTALAAVGNKDGYVGIGLGESAETVPAKTKAIRNAKLNIIKIKRGCGSWECACGEPHSIPFKVEGKMGSTKIVIKPAPKGLRLCIADECKKILRLAGVKDVWSTTFGQTGTRINLAFACFNALKQLTKMKTNEKFVKEAGVKEGSLSE
jgi:small subunit ribosomal protein S5